MDYLGTGLRKLTESGINRIMSHGKNGFIVISANRSSIESTNKNCDLSDEFKKYCKENNLDSEDVKVQEEWLKKRNKKADEELKKAIKDSKYGFSPVFGGYHGEDGVNDSFEPSYIVYNHAKGGTGTIDHLNWEDLKQFALELCGKFKQDCVYVQGPDEAPVYLDKDGNQTNSESTKNFKFNRENEEFFTTSKREKRTKDMHGLKTYPQRFTADIKFENFLRKEGPSSYPIRMQRRQQGEVFLD